MLRKWDEWMNGLVYGLMDGHVDQYGWVVVVGQLIKYSDLIN